MKRTMPRAPIGRYMRVMRRVFSFELFQFKSISAGRNGSTSALNGANVLTVADRYQVCPFFCL